MNDLVEQSRRFLNEQLDEQVYELLNEFISLRTGAIAVGLGKVKQYANKTDQEVRNLKVMQTSCLHPKTKRTQINNLQTH